jgi:hypothetical protein
MKFIMTNNINYYQKEYYNHDIYATYKNGQPT